MNDTRHVFIVAIIAALLQVVHFRKIVVGNSTTKQLITCIESYAIFALTVLNQLLIPNRE